MEIKTILITFVISITIALLWHKLNLWAVPKLQKIYFDKYMELQDLKKLQQIKEKNNTISEEQPNNNNNK